MIDIYFVNNVINIIWYIFSILFVLYKFTSFFSYIYNFCKFLGQLTQGVFYVKDRVVEFTEHRRNQYIYNVHSEQNFFSRMKNKITSYFWGKQSVVSQTELPMYTRISDISFKPQRNKKQDLHFENCINELMTEPQSSFVSIDLKPKYDSNYESYYDPSYPTSELFKNDREYLIKKDTDIENCIESKEYFRKKDIISEPQIINVENVRQKFNIQDSNMLFNSNFIRNFNKG